MNLPTLLLIAICGLQETDKRLSDLDSLSPYAQTNFLIALMRVLNDTDVQKELEIVPSQVAELNERIKKAQAKYKEQIEEYQKQVRENTRSFDDMNRHQKKLQEVGKEYLQEYERLLAEVLLPHQREWLDRTVIWSIIQSERAENTQEKGQPFLSILQSNAIRELLAIDESQARKIDADAEKLQDEFAKELAALHDKYEEKLRDRLNRDQNEKLRRLVGETPMFIFR